MPSVGVATFVDLVLERADPDARLLVGITGPPGSGKSTIANEVCGRTGAALVPMDGFHRRNEDLDALGLRERKGAPDTFEAERFAELIAALRAADRDVEAPDFDRTADEPVERAIHVPADARLVVVEGNYLLHDEEPWAAVAPCLDLIGYVDLDPAVRRARLVERHVRHGRTRSSAEEFVERSDEANAALIERSRDRADVLIVAARG